MDLTQASSLTNFIDGTSREASKRKVDLKQEMRDALVGGGGLVMSQNRMNIERENQVIGQWQNLLKTATSSALAPSAALPPPHPNSKKAGPTVSVSAWNQPKRFLYSLNAHSFSHVNNQWDPFSKPTDASSPTGGSAKKMIIVPVNSSKENIAQQVTSPTGRPGVSFSRMNSVPCNIQKQSDGGSPEGGVFNFRQMLRKTDYAPTDTLRKMKQQKSFE